MRPNPKSSVAFILLCFGLIVAVMVMVAPLPQGTYNSTTDGFAVTLANPPTVVATLEVVVHGDQVACSWNNTTNAKFGDYDAITAIYPDDANSTGNNTVAEIIFSAGPAPPLDVGSSANALNPTTSTGATDANTCAMSRGSDSEARGMVTISKEDGTHRFTAART